MIRNSYAFDLATGQFKFNHDKRYCKGYHCPIYGDGYIFIYLPNEIVVSYNSRPDVEYNGDLGGINFPSTSTMRNLLAKEAEKYCRNMMKYYSDALNSLENA